MEHTFTKLLTHVVFSTKGRAPYIGDDLQVDLFAYMGGVVRNIDGVALGVSGTADHAHMLVGLPPSVALADAVRTIKSNSSRWVHEEQLSLGAFAWQSGYGAFSVSYSKQEDVLRYIQSQAEHHRKRSFREEFIALLDRHGVAYEEAWLPD
jgi:REP-associated tyrosine transposase